MKKPIISFSIIAFLGMVLGLLHGHGFADSLGKVVMSVIMMAVIFYVVIETDERWRKK